MNSINRRSVLLAGLGAAGAGALARVQHRLRQLQRRA